MKVNHYICAPFRKRLNLMGVTRLIRKGRKNKAKSASRRFSLKHLTATPVIKNVDIEELKKQFSAPKKETKKEVAAETKAAAKAEAPVEAAVEAPVVDAPKAEKAEAKKPAAKKAAPKKEAAPKAKAAKKDKDAE